MLPWDVRLRDNRRMDLRQLREQTRPEHEATEAAMPLMAPGLTLETYKSVLRALLPVLRSWERWADEAAPRALQPLLSARRRSHFLEEDLRTLGEMESPNRAGDRASIDWQAVVTGSTEQAQGGLAEDEFQAAFLGAFYVMEGSTLGGRFIAQHVEAVLGLSGGRGDAYFRGHGEGTGALWRESTAAIAAVPAEHAALLIGAARRTFSAFGAVLETLRSDYASVPEGS